MTIWYTHHTYESWSQVTANNLYSLPKMQQGIVLVNVTKKKSRPDHISAIHCDKGCKWQLLHWKLVLDRSSTKSLITLQFKSQQKIVLMLQLNRSSSYSLAKLILWLCTKERSHAMDWYVSSQTHNSPSSKTLMFWTTSTPYLTDLSLLVWYNLYTTTYHYYKY